jgi:hypothetical protein
MRVFFATLAVAGSLLFSGCSLAELIAAKHVALETANCLQAVKSSSEGRIVFARLWASDETDTSAKLDDTNPLSKDEREALIRVHDGIRLCRKILISNDDRFSAWEAPYLQGLYQRSDVIFTKLASGEITVRVANRLTIESIGKFQVDVSEGHPNMVRIDEIQRQKNAEALIQSSGQRATPSATNCVWMGNSLDCTSVGR